MFPLGLIARRAASRVARKAAFGSAAGLCLLVGLGFLLAAAWTAIAAAKGAVFASLVLGLAFLGLGLVFLAVAMARPRGGRFDLDDARIDALNRAARGGRGEMERALNGLLSEVGLPPPARGGAPALAAAFVFGLTLAFSRRRRGRRG